MTAMTLITTMVVMYVEMMRARRSLRLVDGGGGDCVTDLVPVMSMMMRTLLLLLLLMMMVMLETNLTAMTVSTDANMGN